MTFAIRHLRPADYRVMPWKNGQGTTTEIAAFPEGADLTAIDWRLSVADIASSGPFSAFPGIDRVLLQTEGAPMTIVHGSGDRERRRALALLSPVRFAGEWETRGEVPSPPVRDFNVMARRDRARADVAVIELPPGARFRAEGAATARAVHVLRGAIALRAPAAPEGADHVYTLAAGDTWLLAGAPAPGSGADHVYASRAEVPAPSSAFELTAGEAALVIAVTFT